MPLDDPGLVDAFERMQHAWTAQSAALGREPAHDRRQERELLRRRKRRLLLPYFAWQAVKLAGLLWLLIGITPIVGIHGGEVRYQVALGMLAAYVVGLFAISGHAWLRGLMVHYGGPVQAIQRAVQLARRSEYRAYKWALLGGVLIWLPAALIAFEIATGMPALARVNGAWLVANLLFGAVVAVVGQVLSRKHVERPDLQPWALRMLEFLSGRGMLVMTLRLKELARLEREDAQKS